MQVWRRHWNVWVRQCVLAERKEGNQDVSQQCEGRWQGITQLQPVTGLKRREKIVLSTCIYHSLRDYKIFGMNFSDWLQDVSFSVMLYQEENWQEFRSHMGRNQVRDRKQCGARGFRFLTDLILMGEKSNQAEHWAFARSSHRPLAVFTTALPQNASHKNASLPNETLIHPQGKAKETLYTKRCPGQKKEKRKQSTYQLNESMLIS